MKWNNRRRTIDLNSASVRLTLCGMGGEIDGVSPFTVQFFFYFGEFLDCKYRFFCFHRVITWTSAKK